MTLTPEIVKRLERLALACQAVDREIRKAQGELTEAGIRFPDSLVILLDQQRNTLDALFVILNTPHVKADAGS